MIDFCTLEQVSDDRAIFANIACKMLYQKFGGNFTSITFQAELHRLRSYFEEYVRNIYEIIDEEIPLFAWADYLKHGFDETAYDDEDEMTEEKRKTQILEACKAFYE